MGIALVDRWVGFADRTAVRDAGGDHTYAEISATSQELAAGLVGAGDDLDGARVAYLMPPGCEHVAVQWAIWRAGGVAVPLATSYPVAELRRILADAAAVAIVAAEELHESASMAAAGAGIAVCGPAALRRRVRRLPKIAAQRPALMVYTSGTTGCPKGVVTTHANLEAQISTLVSAWEWTAGDRILHVLPLHHVHGIVNALCCALWAGARCEFAPADPAHAWARLASGEITLFMAVPTIYRRLIRAWEEAPEAQREAWSAGARKLRLMVSGSAALPIETLARWEEVTGHRLLERYGMTEIGMALGNPLHGERRAGTVGQPFPGVAARIVGEHGEEVMAGTQGEVEVRGPQVFREYWGRPHDTASAFTADGWFRTGDEAVIEGGYWRLVGRRSVDIIKTGGYKVSALEIEEALRGHPEVEDAAVVGVGDDEWGERVCAAVVAVAGASPDGEALTAWCKERLAPYKVPKQIALLADLPRNALGKVTKPALRPVFSDTEP